MFLKNFRKIKKLIVVILFFLLDAQIVFPGKRRYRSIPTYSSRKSCLSKIGITEEKLADFLEKYNIILVEQISHGFEKTVFKVLWGREFYACSFFNVSKGRPLRNVKKFFKREYKFLEKYGKLNSNIISLIQPIYSDKIFCILTELAYSDLKNYEFIGSEKDIFRSKIEILIDIVNALKFIHGNSLVHCDLKPANVVLFDCDGRTRAKLIDFTFLKKVGIYDRMQGTLLYMSPECLSEYYEYCLGNVDKYNYYITNKCDIYSLGLLTYWLFYGHDIDAYFFMKKFNISLDTFENLEYFNHFLTRGCISDSFRMFYTWFIKGQNRPELNNELVDFRINEFIRMCWDNDPSVRPEADYLLNKLEEIYRSL